MNNRNFPIRPMREGDLDSVWEIEQEELFPWSREQFKGCLMPPYRGLIIEKDNVQIGFAILSTIQDEAELLKIAISKSERGQGFGKLLLTALLDVVKSLEVRTVYLEVRSSNLAALKLYNQMGFQCAEIRKDYYPSKEGREDAIILRHGII